MPDEEVKFLTGPGVVNLSKLGVVPGDPVFDLFMEWGIVSVSEADPQEKEPKPLKTKTPLKSGKPVKKVSARREIENIIYLERREVFLKAHPQCQTRLCEGSRSAEVHHVRGRVAQYFLDETTWLAVCSACHRFIHDNPTEATRLGLLKLKNQITPGEDDGTDN